MKNLTFIGIILLALAFVLYNFIPEFSVMKLFEPTSLMGILAGVGIGLFIGGLVGYISKGSAMREAQKKKEFKQLQKEKKELEEQAAVLAEQASSSTPVEVSNIEKNN